MNKIKNTQAAEKSDRDARLAAFNSELDSIKAELEDLCIEYGVGDMTIFCSTKRVLCTINAEEFRYYEP